MSRRLLGFLLIVSVALLVARVKEFTPPRAFHAKTYPAHEAHEDEGFAIAADPYDLPDKAAPVLSIDFQKDNLLPINIIFSNDNEEPVTLSQMNVKLITKRRMRLDPLDARDIYRRITHQNYRPGPQVETPIPLPKSKPKGVSAQAQNEVENMLFIAKAVEPKATKAGFFVFDVQGIENPLAGASLEITGIKKNGQDMFYFSIPMEKYLGYKPQ